MQLDAPTRSMSTPLLHNLQQQPTHLTQRTVSRLSRIPSFFLQGNMFRVLTSVYASYHFTLFVYCDCKKRPGEFSTCFYVQLRVLFLKV